MELQQHLERITQHGLVAGRRAVQPLGDGVQRRPERLGAARVLEALLQQHAEQLDCLHRHAAVARGRGWMSWQRAVHAL